MLPRIWHLPILEGDGNVVKEPVVGLRQRSQGKTDDANVVEEEEWVVLVGNVSRSRSRLSTPVIHCIKAVEHF